MVLRVNSSRVVVNFVKTLLTLLGRLTRLYVHYTVRSFQITAKLLLSESEIAAEAVVRVVSIQVILFLLHLAEFRALVHVSRTILGLTHVRTEAF